MRKTLERFEMAMARCRVGGKLRVNNCAKFVHVDVWYQMRSTCK